MADTAHLKCVTDQSVCGFKSHSPQSKICKVCNKDKSLDQYFKGRATCKQCCYDKKAERLQKTKGKRIILAHNINMYGSKLRCKRCCNLLDPDQFKDSIHCLSGKRSVCRTCTRIRYKAARSNRYYRNKGNKSHGTKQAAPIPTEETTHSTEGNSVTSQLQEKEID